MIKFIYLRENLVYETAIFKKRTSKVARRTTTQYRQSVNPKNATTSINAASRNTREHKKTLSLVFENNYKKTNEMALAQINVAENALMENFDWIDYLLRCIPFLILAWYIRYTATGKKWF